MSNPDVLKTRPVSARSKAARIGFTLVLGSLGGAIFYLLTLPLPWMLGAMIATLIAAILRAPVLPAERLRPAVVAVIGVMLGAGFRPELLHTAGGWGLSLGFLALYLVVAALLVVPFYRRIGGFDPVTAYFAGMPGGLTEMMTIGRDMGGDDRKIALAHAARIVISISLIAFWFRLIQGYQVSGVASGAAVAAGLSLRDVAILAGCAGLGSVLGLRLRLPAPTLIGPMLLSAAVHMSGLTKGVPPAGLIIACQVLLGTIIGCRFFGADPRMVGRALLLSLGATLITLCVTLAFALMFHRLFGQSWEQVVLAYAPGGLTEMSLVALAMRAEVAYVASHHILRVVLLISLAPIVLRLIRGKTGGQT